MGGGGENMSSIQQTPTKGGLLDGLESTTSQESNERDKTDDNASESIHDAYSAECEKLRRMSRNLEQGQTDKTDNNNTRPATLIHRIELQNEMLVKSVQSLGDKREKIRSYRPGDGILEAGGVGKSGFAIPKVTTLLLVGPSGAGKSTLINNLIRVVADRTIGFDRAQSYDEKGNGSLFLQEYSFYKDENYFSVFDSRGFSEETLVEDLVVVKKWMTEGVHHGEAVCRYSDNKAINEALEGRGRHGHSQSAIKRRVDFVIFLVDAVSVHSMREQHDVVALGKLATLYKSPFLSFKDDRPLIVMTHGDNLCCEDRILTKIFIGDVFGVSPVNQVFDIACFTERLLHPGDEDAVNDLVLLNMLDLALERADRNFPYKKTRALWLKRALSEVVDSWDETKYMQRKMVLAVITILWLFCLAKLFSNGSIASLPSKKKDVVHTTLNSILHGKFK